MLYLEAIEKISKLTRTKWWRLAPVRFGYDIAWQAADDYILASQIVPVERGLIVYRTECYTTCLDPTAPDFMGHGVTPPGIAWWSLSGFYSTPPPDALDDQTDRILPAHLTLDTDNLLLFGKNTTVQLLATLDASPGDIERRIRTVCYAFFISGDAYERLRNNFEFPNIPA